MIKAAGGTGKSTLFIKLHAACRAKGHLILVAASTTLAATVYENANTAHVSK
jgi:MinD superfamily P-loop ATPase